MPISNYPNGFPNGITVRGLPLQQAHPGNVYWVNNSGVNPDGGANGSDSGKGTYLRPFATVDYAIGRCTANRGDIIMVMPGHTEDLDADSDITSDVAGVAIVGLGTGAKRPTFTFSETDSTWAVSAANCTFANIIIEAAKAEVVTAFSLAATADGTSFESIESYEGAVAGTYNFVDVITLASGANNLSFRNCRFIGNDTNNDSFITGVIHDGFYMDNCYFASNVAQASAVGLVDSSGNVTNALITNCYFRSNVDGALWIDFNGAANSGLICNCYVSSIDGAGAVSTGDFTGGNFFECYVAGETGTYGIIGGGSEGIYNNA